METIEIIATTTAAIPKPVVVKYRDGSEKHFDVMPTAQEVGNYSDVVSITETKLVSTATAIDLGFIAAGGSMKD